MNNIEDKINHLLKRLKEDEKQEKQQQILAKKEQKRQETQEKKEKNIQKRIASNNACEKSRTQNANQIPNTADLILSAANQCIFFDKKANEMYKTTTTTQ